MNLETHIKELNKDIRNTKLVKGTSSGFLRRRAQIGSNDIKEFSGIMQNVINSTDKVIKETKHVESRAKSRLYEVNKAAEKTRAHTKNAKYAAIAAKKTAKAALTTFKKMTTPQLEKKYQKIYDVQISGSIRAARVAEHETAKALKASKIVRIGARSVL